MPEDINTGIPPTVLEALIEKYMLWTNTDATKVPLCSYIFYIVTDTDMITITPDSVNCSMIPRNDDKFKATPKSIHITAATHTTMYIKQSTIVSVNNDMTEQDIES